MVEFPHREKSGNRRDVNTLPHKEFKNRKKISSKNVYNVPNTKSEKSEATLRLERLSRAVLVGTFATVAALIFAITSIVTTQTTVARVTSNMTEVVVAARDISPGVVVTSDMVELASVPESYLANSATTSTKDVVGKTAGAAITQNSQITRKMIASTSDASSLAAKISQGHQALTVDVATDSGLYNLLKCGDKVDVFATDATTYETNKIAEKLSVLALDSSLSGPDGSTNYSTVTLEVTNNDALNILGYEDQGNIYLVLNPLSETEGKQ